MESAPTIGYVVGGWRLGFVGGRDGQVPQGHNNVSGPTTARARAIRVVETRNNLRVIA